MLSLTYVHTGLTGSAVFPEYYKNKTVGREVKYSRDKKMKMLGRSKSWLISLSVPAYEFGLNIERP